MTELQPPAPSLESLAHRAHEIRGELMTVYNAPQLLVDELVHLEAQAQALRHVRRRLRGTKPPPILRACGAESLSDAINAR